LLLTVLIDLAPPTQTYQQPPGDVLDHPEIQRAQDNHEDEGDDVRNETANDQVEEDSDCLEGESSHTGHGVTRTLEIEVALALGFALDVGLVWLGLEVTRRVVGFRRFAGVAVKANPEIQILLEFGHTLRYYDFKYGA
jgi:hypothetical protein